MNVLFLCHRIPYPPNKGEKIRALNVLKHLSKSHDVYLGSFVDDADDQQYVPRIQELVGNRCKILGLSPWLKKARMLKALITGEPLSTACFYSPLLQKWIDGLLRNGQVDRAVVFGTAMAPYLLNSEHLMSERVIFDMVDIDSDKWSQYAAGAKGVLRAIYRREARHLFQLEWKAAQQFRATLLVSDFEADAFAALAPEAKARIWTARNGVDMNYYAPDNAFANPFQPSECPIVMTGRMDYRPNTEGGRWFAEKVLPFVQRSVPNARFYVVGARPPTSLKALGGENVVITGSVEDIRPYIGHAAVVVAPLQMARGVQNKVLEAMSMRKGVVATTAASRALNIESGKELWVADGPESFGKAVVDVVLGRGSKRIAAVAREHIEAYYHWDKNLSVIDDLLADDSVDGGVHLPDPIRLPVVLAE